MENTNDKSAQIFVEAIKTLADKPKNLENLECYLSHHFSSWMEKFANSPEKMAWELKQFAEMEV